MKIILRMLLGLAVMGLITTVPGTETGKAPTDAEIRSQAAGTWTWNQESSSGSVDRQTYTFETTGGFSKHVTFIFNKEERKTSAAGKWAVKNGAIVITLARMTTASGEKEFKKPAEVHLKVIRISDHELVCLEDHAKTARVFKR